MMIGQNAGLIGFLTVLSRGYKINGVVCYDSITKNVVRNYGIDVYDSILDYKDLIDNDILISVHGKEIVSSDILDSLLCLNVHPCLYRYKGSNPVGRLIDDGCRKASVGVHIMSDVVDGGEVVFELFKEVDLDSVEGVYNQLYPLYHEAIFKLFNVKVA